MSPAHYDSLADVHDWLVSDDPRTPAGFAGAYAEPTAVFPPGARVLDRATEASPAMVGRSPAGPRCGVPAGCCW